MAFYEFMDLNILIPLTIGFFALLIGSYTDLRTREVPDWINLGLVGTGFGVNLLLTIIFLDTSFIINSVIGFAIFFAFAWIMFYTGQWGGGDSKMLMGLGALIGVDVFSGKIPFMLDFVINFLIVGALYGILWSLFLISKNRKNFVRSFKKYSKSKKINHYKKLVLIIFIILVLSSILIQEQFIRLILLYIAVTVAISFYLGIAVKAVEKSCMLKYVKPSQLTEGDWIAREVKINGKYFTGPKDLGIEKEKITKLIELYKKKKVKKILIKEGIPFVPSFFIAYVITIVLGNIFFTLL